MNSLRNPPRAIRTLNTYLKVKPERPHDRPEFWRNHRIEHIRQLSQTGEPVLTGLDDIRYPDPPAAIRDRLYLMAGEPRPEHVETSVELVPGQIQLSTPLVWGDMSFGAIHAQAVRALVESAERTQILSGTGEGGLLQDIRHHKRFNVQWASARFGVDLDVLNSGSAIVIKIGQGAKPGIGGHLPGSKVIGDIPATRRIPEGQEAISPAPHHDIYSIEDLGQRIWSLKEATGKPVFVKVAATNYAPYIACGIARMGADGIVIDGHLAGTGATPEVIRDNVGMPIEIAIATADRMLREQTMDGEPLRSRVCLIGGGGITSSIDMIRLLALGADAAMMGTGALIAIGCVMVHKCHTGKCPTALATQEPHRLLDHEWATERLVNFVHGLQAELRILLAEMGVASARELIGQRDYLRAACTNEETCEILGVKPLSAIPPYAYSIDPAAEKIWTPWKREHIDHMAETGEAPITSMGSLGTPFVQIPTVPNDWIRSDGAQVTRPSIDPYREEIETAMYLAGGRERISQPIFLSGAGFEGDVPLITQRVLARVTHALGIWMLPHSTPILEELHRYRGRMLEELSVTSTDEELEHFLGVGIVLRDTCELSLARTILDMKDGTGGKPVFVRLVIDDSVSQRALDIAVTAADGILLDETEQQTDTPIEVVVSTVDRVLRSKYIAGGPLRERLNLLVISERVRGAEDIFKLIALGADAVSIGQAALFAMNCDGSLSVPDDEERARDRLENYLRATQKELKLLMGAAGISSVSSLVSSRELLRAVDMDPVLREQLGVKPAGV